MVYLQFKIIGCIEVQKGAERSMEVQKGGGEFFIMLGKYNF